MRGAAPVGEGVRIALDALRAHKLRAALTVLGVVVGVATVILVAGVVGGVRASVLTVVSGAGANSFAVWRFDPDQIVLMGSWEQIWRDHPRVTLEEGARIAALPSVETVSPLVYQEGARLRLGARNIDGVLLTGEGPEWPRFTRGDFTHGRNFLPEEEARLAPVVVLSGRAARALSDGPVVGRTVRVGTEQLTVVGVYEEEPGIVGGGEGSLHAWVPAGTALKRLPVSADFLRVQVVPAPGVTQDQAMDDVVLALRAARRLGPRQENTFVLKTNQAMAEMATRWADAFFGVMVALSSIGLLVGGVGVMAIMLISVTERTAEIGVRMALGATRRDVLWQFLVEAVTVTVLGGVLGILLGGAGARLTGALTPIPAQVPLWAVVAGVAVSAASGLCFGLLPALRAARLDPVEALRYE